MRKGFTLIEVVISIVIFALISLYMYQAINIAQKSNDIYSRHFDANVKTQQIRGLFYNDIFSQTDIYANATIDSSGDFDAFGLRSRNSIHAMINPYITYFVKDNILYRIESKQTEKLPLTYESIERVKVDKLLENVQLFRVYESKNSYLVSYQEDEKLTTFEITLPQKRGGGGNRTVGGNRTGEK